MKQLNRKRNTIVLVGGVFDILHYGHIHFLTKAKSLGDWLVVAIESDERVKKLKGPTRPFHNQFQRKKILESLRMVDEVVILQDEMTDQDYFDLVCKIKPKIIAVTSGDPIIHKKRNYADKIDSTLIEIEKVEVPSTTKIAKLLDLE